LDRVGLRGGAVGTGPRGPAAGPFEVNTRALPPFGGGHEEGGREAVHRVKLTPIWLRNRWVIARSEREEAGDLRHSSCQQEAGSTSFPPRAERRPMESRDGAAR